MSDPNLNPNLPAVAGGGQNNAVGVQMPSDSDDSFIAEFAVMDLGSLRDNTYFVTANTGDRNKCKFLCSTLRGPYSFVEMVQEVGFMWEEHLHHAKAIIAEKDRMKPVKYLDQKTIDYIEAHYRNIIADAFLEDIIGQGQNFTHIAGIIEEKVENDPIITNAKTKADNQAKAAAELGGKTPDEEEDL